MTPAGRGPAGPIAIDVVREAGEWPALRTLRAWTRRAIGAAEASGLPVAVGSEVSVLFTDDAHIRALNAGWRRKDSATNVLSFPAAPPKNGLFGPLLGDVVLAAETVSRESAELGLTFRDHATHLLVHGFLHLLGFDHMHDEEAEVMEGRERAILARLGIGDPYSEERGPDAARTGEQG